MKIKMLFFMLLIPSIAHAMLLDKAVDFNQIEQTLKQDSKPRKKSVSTTSSEMIDFSFTQEPLKDLINFFAHKLNINILYPETETITATVSFNAGRKITMTEAWDFVLMIIEQAGYSLILRAPDTYTLLLNTKSYREPLPLYIGIDFNQLPDSMQRVRYVYYFNNIQISNPTRLTEMTTLLTNMLPTAEIKDQLVFDANSNAMFLTTRADMIKTIMQVITVLDEVGFAQAVELIKLDHAQATDVVKLFKDVLTGGASDPTKKTSGFVPIGTGQRAKYFSDNVRIENLDPNNIRQLNSIIVMGKTDDIVEIKKFIKKYLDIAQEEGKSFFHVIELQWMQAPHLQNVLKSLVQPGTTSGQSTSTPQTTDLSFDPQIQIVSETVNNAAALPSNGTSSSSSGSTTPPPTGQRGANKLVIACATRDWHRIEALIKQLDVPQKQVVIEALVVDLGLDFIRKLGSQIRTRGLTANIFPKNMQAQAGLLVNSVIQPMTDPDYYALTGDLSDILNPDWPASGASNLSTPSTSTTIPVPTTANTVSVGAANTTIAPGSTVMMLNGGKATTNGVWAFFQMLSTHASSKVFTRPMILVSNNQSATVKSSFTKNLAGTVSTGVNPTINYQQVEAPVTITFTPLISDNNTINLGLNINLNSYTNPGNANDGTMLTRAITTNVSIKNGDVLILGGLTGEQTQVSKTSVPFFESIPIVGNLFASRTKNAKKTQLYILVRATVTAPRSNGGMSKITQAASNFITDQLSECEQAFSSLKDPITRWFFNSDWGPDSSEIFEEKISDMPKTDYGLLSDHKTSHTGQTIRNSAKPKNEMPVGWFSDTKATSNFASQPLTEKNSEDMDKLSKLLKDIDNPFIKRVQL
jgi:type II secretory pathway component GspD/PulD (secretin)